VILHVAADGTVRCLYGEEIDLPALGELTIRRVSHVEPDERGCWWAEIVLDGVAARLGPYARRSTALRVEAEFIAERLL